MARARRAIAGSAVGLVAGIALSGCYQPIVADNALRPGAIDKARTDAIVVLQERLRVARERLAEMRERRARASTAQVVAPAELKKTVIVGLVWSGPAPKGVTLELEYFVPGARWLPAYQCRLSRDGRSTTLTLRGLVCQRSGEDWSAAKLELSTAAPLRWTEIPELPALRIGRPAVEWYQEEIARLGQAAAAAPIDWRELEASFLFHAEAVRA